MPLRVKDLTGIVPPLATPMLAPGEPDFAGLERLVQHVTDGGVSGLFILGTTGEGPSLSHNAKREITERVCRQSRLPVLVGLCDPSTTENLKMAGFAAECGAAGLVVTPPYYYRLSQAELLSYLQQLLPRFDLPAYLYNIPNLTKIWISPEVLAGLATIPNMAGLKDSSGSLEYLVSARKALPASAGFRLFCGPEEMLGAALGVGVDGGVCGGANLFPRLYVELYRAARRGSIEMAEHLQEIVRTVSRSVYHQSNDDSSYLRGLKCALSAIHICSPALADPLTPVDGDAARAIHDFVLSVPDLLWSGTLQPLAVATRVR